MGGWVGGQCAYKMNKTTVVYRWNLPAYSYSLQDQVTARCPAPPPAHARRLRPLTP